MLFKRKLRLSLEIDKKLKIYEHSSEEKSLKVDFNITKSLQETENATCSIIGLNQKDILFLTTSFDYKTGKIKPTKIIIEAGYLNDFSSIFEGSIMECEPKFDSADIAIEIKAAAGFYNSVVKREPISLIEAKLSDIARSVANGLGVSLTFEATDKNIGDYSFNGSPKAQFKAFSKQYNIKAWVENNNLFVSDTDKPKQTKVTLINNESGLIGSPTPLANGVKFITLLRPSLKLNTKVKCEFKKFPSLSGEYKIIAIIHKGSNYGNEFFSEIEGVKL